MSDMEPQAIPEGLPQQPDHGRRRPSLLGETIGHYRVTDILGKGGMGEVYAGYDETLQRKVALKALRGRYSTDSEMKARFLQEARILSRLEHPHICKIYDFLKDEDGDLLVLELLNGKTLTDVLKRERLPKRSERIEMAIQIVDALATAHAAGVVHRDLKPGNIMLLDSGTIKVLDFGLARSIGEELSTIALSRLGTSDEDTQTFFTATEGIFYRSTAVDTGTSILLGTPQYMSPEQARCEPATPASDMYSFGLVLQELLTGKSVHEPGAQLREILLRAHRGQSLPARSLPRDLKILIEQLKDSDPQRRPSSQETTRHLRLIHGKGRRRLLFSSIVLVLLLAVSGFAKYTFDLAAKEEAIRAEALRANLEAEAASRALDEAQKVSELLANLFEVSDPDKARGNTITAREILDTGAARIRAGLEDQPLARARFMATIGNVYKKLGIYDEAEIFLHEALTLRRSSLPAHHLDLAASIDSLSTLLQSQGRLEEVEPLLLEALSIKEKALGPEHADVAKTLNRLGTLHARQGLFEKAIQRLSQALTIRENTLGLDHPDVAGSLENLGGVNLHLGRLEGAETFVGRALAIRRRVLGNDHPLVGRSLGNLCLIYSQQGRLQKAETVCAQALALLEKTLGHDHPNMSVILINIAEIFRKQQGYEQAEKAYQRALAIAEKALGFDHPTYGEALYKFARLRVDQERLADAEPMTKNALSILQGKLPNDHPHLAGAIELLAEILRSTGREAEAAVLEDGASKPNSE